MPTHVLSPLSSLNSKINGLNMLFCRTQMLLFSKKLTPSTLITDKAAFASYYLAMVAKKIIFAAPKKTRPLNFRLRACKNKFLKLICYLRLLVLLLALALAGALAAALAGALASGAVSVALAAPSPVASEPAEAAAAGLAAAA